MVDGAVYFPVVSIIPQLVPVQLDPETLHVTAWLAPMGLTVAVNCCSPPAWTVALVGEIATPAGGGEVVVMVKFTALEVPPPGGGVVTVTATVPAEAMAAVGMAAVSCLALTNVVVGDVAPKLTIEAATKFVPLIVSVKGAPVTALLGKIVVIAAVGLGG
jgi:hypothetical protein